MLKSHRSGDVEMGSQDTILTEINDILDTGDPDNRKAVPMETLSVAGLPNVVSQTRKAANKEDTMKMVEAALANKKELVSHNVVDIIC